MNDSISDKRFFYSQSITLQLFKDLVFIIIGILSAGFGLKGFLLPNGFIDGGITGISLLIKELTSFSLSILIVVINILLLF